MQVRVAQHDDRAPNRPLRLSRPWTVAWLGLAVAIPTALWTLLPEAGPVSIPLLLAVLLGLVAAESFTVHFEFRRQGFTLSPSELAFVMALVEVGGLWTAVARAAAIGIVTVTQGHSRPKAAFNVSVVVLEVCAAVALLRLLPDGPISAPATWLAYLVATVAASLLGALLIAAAIT